MDDPFQQQALGRANAACAALFAILDRFQDDERLAALLAAHAEHARALLLNTQIPDSALSEFDKSMAAFQAKLPRIG